MRRKKKREYDVDVLPYLDIMTILLKLICLVLIVMLIPIVLNPKMLKIISLRQVFHSKKVAARDASVPTYFDCRRDGVLIFPGDLLVSAYDIQVESNAVQTTLARIGQSAGREYAILIIRSGSLPVYRHLRRLLHRQHIEVGYDALDHSEPINWRAEARALNIRQWE